MKKILLLLLISQTLSAQSIFEYLGDDYLKTHYRQMSLLFLAGSCDGFSEVIDHHYYKFDEVHPNANQSYWNPSQSWTNKYKNNDDKQGDKYFMSSTTLVWTTDAYHLTRTVHKTFIVAAVCIPLCKRNKNKKFKHYTTDFIVYSACYSLGFTLVYDGIY